MCSTYFFFLVAFFLVVAFFAGFFFAAAFAISNPLGKRVMDIVNPALPGSRSSLHRSLHRYS
jgi:hypothetical protein